ncbi:heavy-metal-associated domain-containing protein [Sanguibacter sp. A247]|uniref:heavy-metal-associated domain-containing protein n=1 Tax=unclassified Sanguibacter TaxID=2645534 RepID=UPI003FD73F2B
MTTTPATSTRTVLRAEGFSCPSCVTKIEKQVGRLPGVADVSVKFASGRIEINHDPIVATVDALVAEVAKAGYTSVPAAF